MASAKDRNASPLKMSSRKPTPKDAKSESTPTKPGGLLAAPKDGKSPMRAGFSETGGTLQVTSRDVSDTGIVIDADIGVALESLVSAARSSPLKDRSVVIPAESGACHFQALR